MPVNAVRFAGLDALVLSTRQGASATVSLYGGQVLSWRTADGSERLYLSPRAVYDGRTALRGGVPVCFPQFAGLGPLPKHGLLRSAVWQLADQRVADDYALVTLATAATDATRALWPHDFSVELTVLIEGGCLEIEISVANPGTEAFRFTGALHTYLRVADVNRVSVEGLMGSEFRDAAAGDRVDHEPRMLLDIRGEVDRVYRDVTAPLLVRAPDGNLAIGSQGFSDVVVWNPGAAKGDAMADLPAGGWREFLCIEAACADRPVTVAPGDEWFGRQALELR